MASRNSTFNTVSIAVVATVVVASAIFLQQKKGKSSKKDDDAKPRSLPRDEPTAEKSSPSVPPENKNGHAGAETRQPRTTLEDKVQEEGIVVKPIGKVNSIYNLCVGTPRQGMLAPDARGRIELDKFGDSSIVDAVMGLEGYSHIWVLFCFHLNTQPTNSKRIKTKVAPPSLGGKKLGILATRTPHRLNPIGITLCKLDRIEKTGNKAILHISGIDLVDGTPIFDIKPYVSFYDSVGGDDVKLPPWVPDGLNTQRNVTFTDEATSELKHLLDQDSDALKFYGKKNGDGEGQPTFDVVSECIRQVLSVDVRSSFQTKKAREGKFQAEKSSRVNSNGSREHSENICSQQLDNLLIQYTVSEKESARKLQQSKGSGAEDAVSVISIKLLKSKDDVQSTFEELPKPSLEEMQTYPVEYISEEAKDQEVENGAVKSNDGAAKEEDVADNSVVEGEESKSIPDSVRRKQMIEQEFTQLIKDTEDNELEDEMEPEAVEALKKAANKICFVKKYYDVMNDQLIYFPSVKSTVVSYTLMEEAEKFYFDEEDEFPMQYSAALRSIATESAMGTGDDEDQDEEYMMRLAMDVDIGEGDSVENSDSIENSHEEEALRAEQARRLEEEAKAAAEAEALRAEQARRLEEEAKATAEAEAEAKEAARLKAEAEETARRQAAEAARLEKIRLEEEAKAKAEEEEKARLAKLEKDRLEAERLEKERLEEEQRLEDLRIQEEIRLQKAEEERLEQLRLEEERRKLAEEEEAALRRAEEENASSVADPTPAEALKVESPKKKAKMPTTPKRSPKPSSDEPAVEPLILSLTNSPKRAPPKKQQQQESMKFKCSVCNVEKARNQFAKAQIKKKTFRCKDCVAARLAEEQ